jgi:hypothetical protein
MPPKPFENLQVFGPAAEEELRAMDDLEFAGIGELPFRPRIKNAPVVKRP